jgi:exonuclease SbcC
MIPLRLKISGFLSYHDPVEVDFSTFELACISGQNGAGKSSLLDAITWVLFGQARKRDDTLINSSSDSAEVVFLFEYEQNVYRIQRILTRGKTTILEFQIQDQGILRALTEATMRQTQARIETILRLDYDTFVNASFFLQGKADQFTQQRPTDRKRILASILGLELWETYRERAAERRKIIEGEMASIDGRLAEINTELAEEPVRKARLKELETELAHLMTTRKAQELVMSTIKQALESLKHQQELVEKLGAQITRTSADLNSSLARQAERNIERSQHLQIVSNAVTVETAYQAWQSARSELEKWDRLADTFREQEKVRQEPLAKIGAEQARLEQERDSLLRREIETNNHLAQINLLGADLAQVKTSLSELEAGLKQRSKLEQSQTVITRFREQTRLRQAPLTEINSEQARLEQELKTLEKQSESVETQRAALTKLQVELDEAQLQLNQAETQVNLRRDLEQQVQARKEQLSALKSGNERLKIEMEALDERIKKLEVAEGAICPLCGQPLNAQDRQKLIDSLRAEGKQKGDEFRKNKAELESLLKEIAAIEKDIAGFGRIEKDHLFHVTNVTKITERIQANLQTVSAWDAADAPHLLQIRELLKNQSYCAIARQNLAQIDRELQVIGKTLGVKTSKEKSIFDALEEKVLEIETELTNLKSLDDERIRLSTRATQLTGQIDSLRSASEEWARTAKPRLDEIVEILATGSFAQAEREKLAGIDGHLKSLGYDAIAHDAIRRAEQAGRSSENNLRELESARATLLPLERELADIQTRIQAQQTELDSLQASYTSEQETLAGLKANTPDLHSAEKALMDAQERENILRSEVGAAQQKVKVLSDLRIRKASYEAQREEQAIQVRHHKALERAFGKDGVPALLIEQALPQIEEKANELLERLSNGTMNVRFITQSGYKDKKRDDLKETLDIQISDGAGTRDYEMFSGGEAFRVNFAIRLALSEILARRTGARLQTLVIDEGFGSQDAQGRQRLIEAINQVKPDFAKILIITHLDELKDAFPNRIEVEKTASGSSVRVI